MKPRIVIVGAGAGGLAAAVDLAREECAVTVLERAPSAGGKLRHVQAGGVGIDAGPTVFTMRWIFEALFADAAARLEDHLELAPLEVLARHAWCGGGRLDLYADMARSAAAIGEFAGAAAARGYLDFCRRSADIYRTLAHTFIAAQRPTAVGLVRRVGLTHLPAMWRTAPLRTLWAALGDHFEDPRLRQLFGRYATYVGSSPWSTPATLMLIAHVEQEGVWRVRGGMRAVAAALQELGAARGARFRFDTHVERIIVRHGRVAGVELSGGERLDADAVVFNGDAGALGAGLLGEDARYASPRTAAAARSLSALTWCIRGRPEGFALAHHNVFFADDYAEEFRCIFERRGIPRTPTVYLCAQDRAEPASAAPPAGPADGQPERLLLLINAPADGDRIPLDAQAVAGCEADMRSVLARCGLSIAAEPGDQVATTPSEFHTLFPGTGGALYGRATHGPMASFQRPGAASRVPGLYFAGGSVHPGPGVPMAVMSGRLAAERLLKDLRPRRARGRPRS